MARKKIREYDAKRLFKAHVQRLAGLDLPINVVQVTAEKLADGGSALLNANPWLANTKLVVKPDMVGARLVGPVCVVYSVLHRSWTRRPNEIKAFSTGATGRTQRARHCPFAGAHCLYNIVCLTFWHRGRPSLPPWGMTPGSAHHQVT